MLKNIFITKLKNFEVDALCRDTKANGTIFMTLPLNLLPLVTQFLPLALLHLTPDSFSAS